MMLLRRLLGFLPAVCIAAFLLAFFPSRSFAEEQAKQDDRQGFGVRNIYDDKKPNVEVVADSLEYSKTDKKVIAQKNVVITYENLKMTADYAEVETETKKAYARGHVIVFRDEEPSAQGHEAYYDFANKTGDFPNGRLVTTPWYGRGKEVHQVREGLGKIKDGGLTTCDREKPHYEVKAKKATVYVKDKIIARNVTVYVLGKPIFWWPYLVIPLQNDNVPLTVNVGYDTKHGAFIETSKGFSINKHLYGKLMADWRSKNGAGAGAELAYDYGRLGHGSFLGYWTQDKRGPSPNAENPYSEKKDSDRWRLRWRHRTDIDPYTNIIARYERMTDEYFLQDFFEKEFRSEVEPQSFVTVTKNSERYGAMVHVSRHMNNFERTVERLPEVRLDWKNQPFIKPGLFYESQASYSALSKHYGRSGDNVHANRFDTVHEWTLPLSWQSFKWTPSADIRGTFYSREKEKRDSAFRTVLGLGSDLRTQFYKKMDVNFDKLGLEINGLRHVLEPLIGVRSVLLSTVGDEDLNRFDHIDTLNKQQVITFGLENRLQTKRVVEGKLRRVDIVSLNTYVSAEFHPRDENEGRKFTELQNELVLRPYEWLQYQLRFDFNLKHGQFPVFNQDVITRFKRFRFLFGHRYYKDMPKTSYASPVGGTSMIGTMIDGMPPGGSNQFVFEGKYIFNPLWQFGGYIRWDTKKNDVDEWQVSATRDLHCWILDFGYNMRNSAIRSPNQELFFALRMKADPRVYVRGGGSRAGFAAPRIGDTISGANLWSPASEVFTDGYWN